jgi:hypothetical protein
MDEIVATAGRHGVNDKEVEVGIPDDIFSLGDAVTPVKLSRPETVHDLDQDGHAERRFIKEQDGHLLKVEARAWVRRKSHNRSESASGSHTRSPRPVRPSQSANKPRLTSSS